MAAGVVTWVWSPIKFQADMGILLTFMFLWNMVGALVLIPALSYFLLRRVGGPRAETPAVASDAGVVAVLPEGRSSGAWRAAFRIAAAKERG
jgi:hypothetical protein